MASDEETLLGRLKVVNVPPSAMPIVQEAWHTLEAVRQVAVQEGNTKIVRIIDEGVKE